MSDNEKAALCTLFEWVAAVLDLVDGRIELVYRAAACARDLR